MVKIDLAYLEFKTNILTLFSTECENGIYKHKDVDVMAREEYEEQKQLEQAIEEKANIIIERIEENLDERGEEDGENTNN